MDEMLPRRSSNSSTDEICVDFNSKRPVMDLTSEWAHFNMVLQQLQNKNFEIRFQLLIRLMLML